MPFINHEDLKALAVIVPPISKQKELITNYKSKMPISFSLIISHDSGISNGTSSAIHTGSFLPTFS